MTKREKLIAETLARPYQVGDLVSTGDPKKDLAKILEINGDTFLVVEPYRRNSPYKINRKDIKGYSIPHIGAYPMKENYKLKEMPNSIGSIVAMVNNLIEKKFEKIKELNFDPTVTINGEKQHYQRGHVWTLQQKQDLIDSLYYNIDCGKIVLKENEVDAIYKAEEGFFYDVVDGKQRLTAIHGFVNDEYPDSMGNYFSDFSIVAQRKFSSLQNIKVMCLDVSATDKEILEQFLATNFAGVPQSSEHINFVKELFNKA